MRRPFGQHPAVNPPFPIDIIASTNVLHRDDPLFIVDRENDAIRTGAHPEKAVLVRQRLDAMGPWLGCERHDLFINPVTLFSSQLCEASPRGPRDLLTKLNHADSFHGESFPSEIVYIMYIKAC